jgi:hypothetical protein
VGNEALKLILTLAGFAVAEPVFFRTEPELIADLPAVRQVELII